MTKGLMVIAGLAGLITLGGCEMSRGTTRVPEPAVQAEPITNPTLQQGYALVYDVVNKQSDVGKILWLKSVTPPTKALIQRIAAVSTEAASRLKPYALEPMQLPAIETSTRGAIETATRNRLLFTGGDAFEVGLLLTQASATEYAAALARQIAEMEPDPAMKQWLNQFAVRYDDLNKQVSQRLTVRKAEKPS